MSHREREVASNDAARRASFTGLVMSAEIAITAGITITGAGLSIIDRFQRAEGSAC
jgi:hypothetical protein